MRKLSFTEKNSFVVTHKCARYFSLDLELFRRKFLIHRLNNDLARANTYTFDRLDGKMLYELLEVCSPEEILSNRGLTSVIAEDKLTDVKTDDELKKEFEALKGRVDELEQTNSCNEDEIDSLRSLLDGIDPSIEELKSAVEELEKKALKKKEQAGGVPSD
ncbi:MAG: hypothetical protein LBR08_11195 [Bacteroidales bacterium]|jgi:predicted nuclease with TOPRIM domain|nr:hypothetical protein [Bacteroidales bacterium]